LADKNRNRFPRRQAARGPQQLDYRQIALAPSLHLDAIDADWRTYTAIGENPQYTQQNRQAAWWKLALGAPDQLRQRVAFALSQILVVSDANGTLANNSRALTNYYDILVKGSFSISARCSKT